MKVIGLGLCLVILLISVHRLPAPIVETEENPTPAPEQSEAPKPKEKHSRAKLTTSHAGLAVNGSATFRRGQNVPASTTANPAEFPVAKPDPNRPGFVYNPFDPTATHLLDVRGKPSGSKVIEPKSGRTFIVP